MAWYPAYETTLGTYTLIIERDLASAPTVQELFIIGDQLKFSTSTEYGSGFLNYIYDSVILNENDIVDIFAKNEVFKTRLRIKESTSTRYLLYPSPHKLVFVSGQKQRELKITWTDGSFKTKYAAASRFNLTFTDPEVYLYALLDAIAEYIGWDGQDNWRYYHNWRPVNFDGDSNGEITPWQSIAIATSFLSSDITYQELVEFFSTAFLATIGQSRRFNSQPVLIMTADPQVVTVSDQTFYGFKVSFGSPTTATTEDFTLPIYGTDKLTKQSLKAEKAYGLSVVKHEDSVGAVETDEDNTEFGKYLPNFQKTVGYDIASFVGPLCYNYLAVDFERYTPLILVDPDNELTSFTILEALTFWIKRYIGSEHIQAEFEIHEAIDPIFPFIIDVAIDSVKYIFRAIEGEINLRRNITTVTKAISLGEYS